MPDADSTSLPIVHFTYHKMGTVWLTRVFERIASDFGWSVQKINGPQRPDPHARFIVVNHSHRNVDDFGQFIGSRMVRDLRDVVVSGYFYHLWTQERWVLAPSGAYGGNSYQEHLKSLDQHAGIMAEIDRLTSYARIRNMRSWNVNDPRIFEFRYETLIANEQKTFQTLFEHYQFSGERLERAIELAMSQSFQHAANRKPGDVQQQDHLRSGKPGEWRDVFGDDHKQKFKESLGDLLIQLRYETDDNW